MNTQKKIQEALENADREEKELDLIRSIEPSCRTPAQRATLALYNMRGMSVWIDIPSVENVLDEGIAVIEALQERLESREKDLDAIRRIIMENK